MPPTPMCDAEEIVLLMIDDMRDGPVTWEDIRQAAAERGIGEVELDGALAALVERGYLTALPPSSG